MSGRGNIFIKLEKFIGCKYPSFIKSILLRSGFDCEASLLLLNEEKLKKIEVDLAAYPELLKDTVYETKNRNPTSEFNFLFGHRELILNIPETIRNKNREKKEKNTRKNIEKNNLLTERNLDIDVLSEKLITKINNYFQKKKTSHVKLTSHILTF